MQGQGRLLYTIRHENNIMLFAFFAFSLISLAAKKSFPGTFVDTNDPEIPADFAFQGEYEGDGMGAQVIALDKGAFQLSFFFPAVCRERDGTASTGVC